MHATNRRQFLTGVGSGLGRAAIGVALANRLGFAASEWLAADERLRFGALDPLVDLMQETPPDELQALLVKKLRAGTPLSDVVAAAALANSRAFGGTNYNAYHALMAMMPSYAMAAQMPAPLAALPVLKVVYRNASFIQHSDRAHDDALARVEPRAAEGDLVDNVRRRELDKAECDLATLVVVGRDEAFEALQIVVRDDLNVHRVVLAWRAYDTLRVAGEQNALTLLRQSVRFCIDEDGARVRRGGAVPEIQALLPKLMEEHKLEARERGTRKADDAWIESLGKIVFACGSADVAQQVAEALSDGFDPEDVGAALSLAAAKLLLHDPGRSQEEPGKPVGSMHGASVGVHASDAANAWRHIARIGSARNAFASLITGAYHTAGQSHSVGAQPFDHEGEACTKSDPAELLGEIEGRIRDRDQRAACIAARRYCELGHASNALFARLLTFAVEEDGALHAEKYFLTASEEHAAARPAHRAQFLVALTRVMASGYGFPAPGGDEARKLLTA
jgi:hypothetical protein